MMQALSQEELETWVHVVDLYLSRPEDASVKLRTLPPETLLKYRSVVDRTEHLVRRCLEAQ